MPRGTEDRRTGTVHSDNEFRFLDLRQDWSWALSDTQLPRWGFNIGQQRGDYDYALSRALTDPLIRRFPIDDALRDATWTWTLRKLGAYARGVRAWGHAATHRRGRRRAGTAMRYGGGLEFDAVSPRLNAVYAFGDDGELRAAWGVMHQPQAVNELQVEDNVTQFFAPERVQQCVLGYTHHFARGLSARLDVYDKAYDDLQTALRERARSRAADPGGSGGPRTHRCARGACPRRRAHAAARSRARTLGLGEPGVARAEDREDGDWTPRSWEQRETLVVRRQLDRREMEPEPRRPVSQRHAHDRASASNPRRCRAAVTKCRASSGRATATRLGPYSRVDLRVNRDVLLASSKLSLYLEVTNLLDSRNECCIEDYRVEHGRPAPVLVVEKSYWLPMLPSFGVQWEF